MQVQPIQLHFVNLKDLQLLNLVDITGEAGGKLKVTNAGSVVTTEGPTGTSTTVSTPDSTGTVTIGNGKTVTSSGATYVAASAAMVIASVIVSNM